MPIYEFSCKECGAAYEARVSRIGGKAACPECGSRKVTRRLSLFARGSSAAGGAARGGFT
jgi:putative FmdB family regulatory protein